jgi:hypothetical protein
MGGSKLQRRTGHPWRLLLAILCVVLVVFTGTVQVAHAHADADTHADCSLCAVAHITVHMAQTPAPAPPVVVVTVLQSLPPVFLPVALSTFALFTRPPPMAAVPA